MITYQVSINDTMPIGKSILALLRSLPEAISLQRVTTKNALYKDLEHAFKDVREIQSGKQKRQTLREFINEL